MSKTHLQTKRSGGVTEAAAGDNKDAEEEDEDVRGVVKSGSSPSMDLATERINSLWDISVPFSQLYTA